MTDVSGGEISISLSHQDVIFLNIISLYKTTTAQIYRSVSPVDETGRLIWHAFSAKTLQLIHKHIFTSTMWMMGWKPYRTLLKYQLHHDEELFDRTYKYIAQYY